MASIRIRKFSPNAPITTLVAMCLLGTVLSFVSTQQQMIQLASVACLAGAGVFSILLRRIRPESLSLYEFVLLFYALTSAFISSMLGYYNASAYSLVLFLCVISIAAIVRTLSLRELFNLFIVVSVPLVLIPLATYMPQLLGALALRINDETGLERFTPFAMHPNLVGFTYSGTAVLLACRGVLAERRIAKLFFLALAALSVLFIIAASARSAMLGIVAAAGVYVWTVVTARGGNRKRRIRMLFVLVLLGLAALSIESVRGYLLKAFEVESDSRGVGSGASGRLDIWKAGVDLLLDYPVRLLFGYGFRTSDPEIIGFPVESSYINLCLEIGVIGAALVIGMYAVSSLKMVLVGRSNAYGEEGRIFLFFGLATIAFMAHSIFNRYLVGIGNPMSLMSLMMMSAFSIRFRTRKPAPDETFAPAGRLNRSSP